MATVTLSALTIPLAAVAGVVLLLAKVLVQVVLLHALIAQQKMASRASLGLVDLPLRPVTDFTTARPVENLSVVSL